MIHWTALSLRLPPEPCSAAVSLRGGRVSKRRRRVLRRSVRSVRAECFCRMPLSVPRPSADGRLPRQGRLGVQSAAGRRWRDVAVVVNVSFTACCVGAVLLPAAICTGFGVDGASAERGGEASACAGFPASLSGRQPLRVEKRKAPRDSVRGSIGPGPQGGGSADPDEAQGCRSSASIRREKSPRMPIPTITVPDRTNVGSSPTESEKKPVPRTPSMAGIILTPE